MRSDLPAIQIMNSNYISASNDCSFEFLDESTIDFMTSCTSPFTAFKSPSSASPSSYSSNESSPTSNWTIEPDDSGFDVTNMSCCTNYASSPYSSNTNITTNTNESTCSTRGSSMINPVSFAGTTNFFLQGQQQPAPGSQLPLHAAVPQPVSQTGHHPVFQRSNSLFSDCTSNLMSDTSGGFRSHSSSFSNGQRPAFSQMTGGLQARSANCLLPTPGPPSLHQEETEATLFEFPSPIQVAQVSSRTGSTDQLSQQQVLPSSLQPQPLPHQPELRILSQPSRNHRARYRTEGSRGAIKDRLGRSFPVIKLYGYNLAGVKVRCFIGHDKKPGEPHLYYQVSRIVGKSITPCAISKVDGIKIIEFELSPENDMQAVVNCIGIVKERNFDVQRKSCNVKRKSTGVNADQDDESLVDKMLSANSSTSPVAKSNQLMKRSTTCNLVFTAYLPGLNQTVQAISDPINCAQILGSPEVHKISSTRDLMCGGSEVFVIGKNFTRDSKIVWDFLPQHKSVAQLMVSESNHCSFLKSEKSWIKETDPESEFVNQNHLVFRVPPLKTLTHDYDGNEVFPNTCSFSVDQSQKAVVPVTLRIRCGEKYSEPIIFTFMDPSSQNHRIQSHDLMSASFAYS